jgi:hypothetical protein
MSRLTQQPHTCIHLEVFTTLHHLSGATAAPLAGSRHGYIPGLLSRTLNGVYICSLSPCLHPIHLPAPTKFCSLLLMAAMLLLLPGPPPAPTLGPNFPSTLLLGRSPSPAPHPADAAALAPLLPLLSPPAAPNRPPLGSDELDPSPGLNAPLEVPPNAAMPPSPPVAPRGLNIPEVPPNKPPPPPPPPPPQHPPPNPRPAAPHPTTQQ